MKSIYLLALIFCISCGQPGSADSSSTSGQQPAESTEAVSATENHRATETQAPRDTAEEDDSSEAAPLVYVTNDGDKYHTADCRYSKTAHEVTLSQAKADGKTACGICKPSSKTGEKQIRCSVNTAEGKRCQRMTTDSSGKCFQHRNS